MINNKQKIIDAAFSLSVKKGFDNVSMKQIQEESGLAIGSIYYHFENKDEILDYLVKKYVLDSILIFTKEMRELDIPFIEKLKYVFSYKTDSFATKETFSEYSITRPAFDHKDLFAFNTSVFHHHPEIRHYFYEGHDKLFELYYEMVEEAIENGEVRDDIDIKKTTILINTALKGYTVLWVYIPELTLDEIVKANIEMIWNSIKK